MITHTVPREGEETPEDICPECGEPLQYTRRRIGNLVMGESYCPTGHYGRRE